MLFNGCEQLGLDLDLGRQKQQRVRRQLGINQLNELFPLASAILALL